MVQQFRVPEACNLSSMKAKNGAQLKFSLLVFYKQIAFFYTGDGHRHRVHTNGCVRPSEAAGNHLLWLGLGKYNFFRAVWQHLLATHTFPSHT